MNEQDKSGLDRILLELGNGDRRFFDSLSVQEREYFLKILLELKENGNSESLNTLWEIDYERKPVDIMTFMNDPEYLGSIYGDNLYEGWIPHLKEIYKPGSPYLEIILSGAIGLGKTNIAIACLQYDLYNLLCLRKPQSYYGLTPNSEIVFALFNTTMTLTEKVGTAVWNDHVNNSPYLRELCEVNKYKKDNLIFPKNIQIISGSKFTHALGSNVFGSLLDEANFGKDVVKADGVKSQMLENYSALLRRMESRFKDISGKIPGHMFLVSSKKSDSDFLERHAEDSAGKPTTYIVDEPIYKIKTHYFDSVTGQKLPRFKGPTFRVLKGDQRIDSRILLEDEEAPAGYPIIKVPVEYRDAFETDVENSLRDISGESVGTLSSLIKDRETIRSSINKERAVIFPVQTVYLSFNNNEDQLIDYMDVRAFKIWVDKSPSAPRALHIDLGITGDAAGIACGFLSGETTISRTNIELEHEEYVEPTISIDFQIRVKNQEGQRLPFDKITRFVYDLQRMFGITIHYISTDGFQSEYIRQKFSTKGINTGVVSVDKKDTAYLALRQIHAEGRIDMYHYEYYLVELFSLIRNAKKQKVDHQEKNIDGTKGSKDVTDAVAGVCVILYKEQEFMGNLSKPTSKQLANITSEIRREIVEASLGIPDVFDLMKDKDDEEDKEEFLSDYY